MSTSRFQVKPVPVHPCCYAAIVIDTHDMVGDASALMCECQSVEIAEKIAGALNAQHRALLS